MIKRKKSSYIYFNTSDLEKLDVNGKREIAFFLKLKSLYSKGIIYNYSPYSLARKMNISLYMAKKYVPAMLRKEWCLMFGGHLVIRSYRVIFGSVKNRDKIRIDKNFSIDDVVDELNWQLFKKLIAKAEFMRECKSTLICASRNIFLTRRQRRLYKKIRRQKEELLHEGFTDANIFGLRSIAKTLGVSLFTASKLMKRFESWGFISRRQVKYEVGEAHNKRAFRDAVLYGLTPEEIYSRNWGYYYEYRGKMYRHMGTAYQLNTKMPLMTNIIENPEHFQLYNSLYAEARKRGKKYGKPIAETQKSAKHSPTPQRKEKRSGRVMDACTKVC